MNDRKNPYPPATPEWQLWESMTSYEANSRAWHDDAQRFLGKSQAAREAAEIYRETLDRLRKAKP